MCLNPIYIKSTNIFVDCRKCPECKLKRAKEWACRLYYELKNHKNACFITLTYDNEHNPKKLSKYDIQCFIKRLRERIAPDKIKYYLCGEYGDHTYRPHYHIIILGYDFPDKIIHGKSKKMFPLYWSYELSQIWTKGIHTIQDTSVATCIYTALYTGKSKYNLPKSLQDAPEFNLLSLGLGTQAIIDDYDKLKLTDQIWIDGQSYTIPQCVLKKLFLTYKDGKIETKDDEYIELKAARLKKRNDRYPMQAKLAEELINKEADIDTAVDRIKAINAYNKAQKAYRKPLDEKKYRADKRTIVKEL